MQKEKTMPLIIFEDKSMNPLPLKGSVIGANSIDVNMAILDKFFVGKTIRVYWSQAGHQLSADGSWITSMCIKGKLEQKGHWYRVLVDNETYTYFDLIDILSICVRSKNSKVLNSISLVSKNNS